MALTLVDRLTAARDVAVGMGRDWVVVDDATFDEYQAQFQRELKRSPAHKHIEHANFKDIRVYPERAHYTGESGGVAIDDKDHHKLWVMPGGKDDPRYYVQTLGVVRLTIQELREFTKAVEAEHARRTSL